MFNIQAITTNTVVAKNLIYDDCCIDDPYIFMRFDSTIARPFKKH
jgi:hypothetical protein